MRLNVWKRSWELSETCPCDKHFVEYLDARRIRGQAVFHFGSGAHHLLGVHNARRPEAQRNHILAVTASAPEHEAYVGLVSRDARVATHYKVLFADIYTLSAPALPAFDLVTLFHLCEFYDPQRSRYAGLDDRTLLELFVSKLNPGGRLVVFTGSNGFARAVGPGRRKGARGLIADLVRQGRLVQVDAHETLQVYERC